MTLLRTIVLTSSAVAACQTAGPDEPAEAVSALVAEPFAPAAAELREVIEAALPGQRILLADDALRESSLLVVERRRHERLGGPLASGVPDETPQRFRLILRHGDSPAKRASRRTQENAPTSACELIHLNTGKRYPLARTRCRRELEATDEGDPQGVSSAPSRSGKARSCLVMPMVRSTFAAT